MILSGSAVHVKGFGSALDNGAAVRSCQRQTQVFDLPVRRMISLVPTPSALERMIAARQACFCEALRFGDHFKSAADGPRDRDGNSGAHAPDSQATETEESQSGLFCQAKTTRVGTSSQRFRTLLGHKSPARRSI